MLDAHLVCYSWITGIPDVAQVVFVRKRLVQIQYFRTTITEVQRGEFGRLVDDTIRGIESAQFLPHSGVRFPQNPVRAAHTWASVWDNSNSMLGSDIPAATAWR
jgi:hypothetical protein